MNFVLKILKSPEIEYNTSSLARELNISAMGALKIAKKLEKENILISRILGKAKFYKLNFKNEYSKQYIKYLLKKEIEQANSYIKRWVNELKKIKNADCIILFGSVLKKCKEAKDIDVLLVTDEKRFKKLKKEIEEINLINVKRIHPVFQIENDLKEKIRLY